MAGALGVCGRGEEAQWRQQAAPRKQSHHQGLTAAALQRQERSPLSHPSCPQRKDVPADEGQRARASHTPPGPPRERAPPPAAPLEDVNSTGRD